VSLTNVVSCLSGLYPIYTSITVVDKWGIITPINHYGRSG
jgi:hypothetical protein